MKVKDFKNNITVINLLSRICLNRECYVPQIIYHNNEIEYICGRRQLRGCPKKYIIEEKQSKNNIKQKVILNDSKRTYIYMGNKITTN